MKPIYLMIPALTHDGSKFDRGEPTDNEPVRYSFKTLAEYRAELKANRR